MILIKSYQTMRSLVMFWTMAMILLLSACKDTPNGNREAANGVVEENPVEAPGERLILFFGNSLTAGYGLDAGEAFPELIQQKIDSLGLSYQVVNAGLSGETTSGGKNRIDWVLKENVEIFVLELGANDGLRGIPLEQTENNLQDIIDFVREQNPGIEIILTGMQIPPNMGEEYTDGFRSIFPRLAEKNQIQLVPFLLKDVAGKPELNQQDGIHPTAGGQEILADNVWEILKDVIAAKQPD